MMNVGVVVVEEEDVWQFSDFDHRDASAWCRVDHVRMVRK